MDGWQRGGGAKVGRGERGGIGLKTLLWPLPRCLCAGDPLLLQQHRAAAAFVSSSAAGRCGDSV